MVSIENVHNGLVEATAAGWRRRERMRIGGWKTSDGILKGRGEAPSGF
jgi:hypothetical protein